MNFYTICISCNFRTHRRRDLTIFRPILTPKMFVFRRQKYSFQTVFKAIEAYFLNVGHILGPFSGHRGWGGGIKSQRDSWISATHVGAQKEVISLCRKSLGNFNFTGYIFVRFQIYKSRVSMTQFLQQAGVRVD